MIAAVFVAAGRGLRMGSDQPKQFLALGGKPILVHTLDLFLSFVDIDPIILVVAQKDLAATHSMSLPLHSFHKRIHVVTGGECRQASVFNGLQAIDAQEGIVLIHDGARPLVSMRLIEACIQGARSYGACIPALTVNDTMKRVDDDDMVSSTVTRQGHRLVQTPQAFKLSLIRRAHQRAAAEHWQATDDASLVERLGDKVKVIPGEMDNFKITTPEDLRLAEVLLRVKALPG
jgi:2-C-methyl-D-erythritol 4-phosphate cytidylyltransferase